jgi:hypothetical protein
LSYLGVMHANIIGHFEGHKYPHSREKNYLLAHKMPL